MIDASAPDDEIISSYLDGEGSPSEVARVESNPIWMQRASELRATAALMTDPVPPLESNVIDQMISAAIGAGQVPANVTDLSIARRSRMPQILTAAAAVVILALAVPIIRSIGNSSGESDSAATSFPTENARADTATSDDQALAESALAPESFSPAAADSAGSSMPPELPPVDTASFDPLPALLPDAIDVQALQEELAAAVASDPRDSTSSRAMLLQPEITTLCADALAEFASHSALLNSPPMPESFTDFSLVSMNGTTNLVALIQLEPGRFIALLVDATACVSVSQISVAP